MTERLYLGIDVGTGSARAAVFDGAGVRRGLGTHPIQTWRPAEDFVEQSSDDIWTACCEAVHAALEPGRIAASNVVGVGFDATCSLVALDDQNRPVSVSPTGHDAQNVIVWMDHRATEQATRINAGQHPVLRYVGSTISPEMETPKLLWLKQALPTCWQRAARFFDLPDFLTYRATGVDTRSLCSTVCKWTYLGQEQRWDASYFESIGLGDLVAEGFRRIGTRVRPLGERIGGLTETAARELGLEPGTAVGVSIIDAHAGGLGMLGLSLGSDEDGEDAFEQRLALIGGTSSCHMAVSREPRFIDGVWGPYFSAMVPGLWLTEGGQSATGVLIDHVVKNHAQSRELEAQAARCGASVYTILEERLDALAETLPFPAALTAKLHVYPDFHGNRSPRADPLLRGMISGLKLDDSLDALAVLYLSTIQAVAHGTRHIIDILNANGYRIQRLIACGGDTKSSLFVREHADITGCSVILPAEPEAVLLGAAMLGAAASGDQPSVEVAMRSMSSAKSSVEPATGDIARYHQRKHAVFHRMYDDQRAYDRIMDGAS